MQYRRISADCHLDLPWLPPELFVENAARELKDRMPYVEDGPDGPKWTTKAGVHMGIPGAVGSVGAPFVPGQNYRVDKMAETGLYDAGKRGERRPATRICASRRWRRTASMPRSSSAFSASCRGSKTTRRPTRCLRIYNDWLKEFCSHYPDRQIGLACLPYGDVEAAAKEVYRVAKLGLRGLELSCSWDMEPMWHPMWEPLWKAVNDVQLPLHFHTFPAIPQKVRMQQPGQVRRMAQFTSVAGFQMNLINIIAAVIGAGVLERYPEHPPRLWRERHRLDPLRARPHGFRVRGPLPRPDEAEAERILAPPVQGDVPVRPDRAKADRRDGRRDPDVGFGLSAPGRRLAGILEIHRGAVRRPARRHDPQDHLRKRRQVLRA